MIGTVCPGAGLCAGAAGLLFAGTLVGEPSSTVEVRPALRVARIDSVSDVNMKSTAEIVVAFESSVAEPRGPNAVCEPMPPNAPARSAAFPLCSRTTMIRKEADQKMKSQDRNVQHCRLFPAKLLV